ncbi:MAG: hypothetical protein ACI37Z_02955 [Candidatus Gastranaerophilaceae bacterium]
MNRGIKKRHVLSAQNGYMVSNPSNKEKAKGKVSRRNKNLFFLNKRYIAISERKKIAGKQYFGTPLRKIKKSLIEAISLG